MRRLPLRQLFQLEDVEAAPTLPRNKLRPALPLPFDSALTLYLPAGATRTVDLALPVRKAPGALRYQGLLREARLPRARDASVPPDPLPTVDGVAVIDRARALGGIEALGLNGRDVNLAIDRGRDWMMAQIANRFAGNEDPSFKQRDLLLMLALVHARAHEEFPEFAEHLEIFLDQQRPGEMTEQTTYRCGLLAMLLDALDDPARRPLVQDVATYLVNAQQESGTWPYASQVPPWMFRLRAPKTESKDDGTILGPLRVLGGGSLKERPSHPAELRAGEETVSVRRRIAWARESGDNSLAQYALLGLHACESQGVKIDRSVWRRALRTVWARQQTTGGWGYTASRPYGSMTCAGTTLATVAMRALEPARDPLLDRRVHAGCAWLAKFWRLDTNPKESGQYDKHLLYHYYGVERTGRLLDTEFFGSHEWYPLLARELVNLQTEGGKWPAGTGERDTLRTAFAVLILTRATETLDPEARERERLARDAKRPTTGRLEMEVVVQKASGAVLALDASGSMLSPPASSAKGDRTTKFEHARAALLEVVEQLPEGTPAGLVVYGHRHRARDKDASTDVEVIVPVAALMRDRFVEAIRALKARGKTPLALALKESRAALRAGKLGAGTVILLTDGG
ncbi:MAG: VWA domain-containing protein, partial [Planctomycetota bacterium]